MSERTKRVFHKKTQMTPQDKATVRRLISEIQVVLGEHSPLVIGYVLAGLYWSGSLASRTAYRQGLESLEDLENSV